MEKAQPIQLLNYCNQKKTYTFDKEALDRIIEENEVQDLPLSVISVAGEFRKGKSFLLNFFLRYLNAEDQENWLNDSSESLEGFAWRGGTERKTEGIHVWSKIFKLPTADESQVAVILMDTQGTFDGKSSNKTSSIIFALSSLVCSIQIYNLSQQINDNDLENLLLVTAYASFYQEESEQNPFQTLLFLVRDWQNDDDYPYGEEGGKEYLDKKLQITPDQEDSLNKVRKNLRSSFEKLSCVLLPYPGKPVTKKYFKGRMKDIDEEFITHIRTFIPAVLSPNNLVVKNINGIELKCSDLVHLFATYVNHYNSDGLPDERSKAEAFAETYCAPMMKRAVSSYRTRMMKMIDVDRIADCTSDVFSEAHKRMQTMAQSEFNKAKHINAYIASRLSARLTEEIDELFPELNVLRSHRYKVHAENHYHALVKRVVQKYTTEMNAAIDKVENLMLEVRLDRYSPTGFGRIHEKYRKVAIDTFGEGNRFGDYDAREFLENMTRDIDDLFKLHDLIRKSKFESVELIYYDSLLKTCLAEYKTKIHELMNGTQQVKTSNLHETYKSEAINHFNLAQCYSKDMQSKYLEKIQTCIDESYDIYQQHLSEEETQQKLIEQNDKIIEDLRKDQEKKLQLNNEEIRKAKADIAERQKQAHEEREKLKKLATEKIIKLKDNIAKLAEANKKMRCTVM